jgi:hypothetical protein
MYCNTFAIFYCIYESIDECLDALGGSKFFSTLDHASDLWQVAMDPNDAEEIAFVTHRGQYEWTVMMFGLCNASGLCNA